VEAVNGIPQVGHEGQTNCCVVLRLFICNELSQGGKTGNTPSSVLPKKWAVMLNINQEIYYVNANF